MHDGTSTQRLTEILAPLTMTMLGGSFQLRKEQAREGRWRKDLLATARTAKGMNSSVPRGGAAQAGKGRPDIRLAWPLLEGEIRALQVDTTSHGCDRLAAGAAARLLPAADTEAAAPISTPLQPTPVLRVTVEGAAVPPGQVPPPAVTEGAALTSTHQRPTQLLRRTAEVAAVSRAPARAHPVKARPKGQQPQVQAVLPPVAVKGALQPRPQHPQLPRSRIQGTSDLIREVPNSDQ